MSTAKIITLAQGNGASGSSIPSDSPAHPLQSGEGTGADSGSASVPVPENGQYTPATETSPSALPSTGYVSSLSAISTAIFSNPSTISPPVSAPSSPINTLATSSIIATVTSAAGAPFGTLSSDSGQQAPSQSSIVAGDVTAAQSSASEASPTQTPVTSKSNGLAGGTVAGIVVAVAVAIALLTFLATCFLARRKYTRTQYGRRMEPLSSEKPAPAPISKESAATVSAASSDTMGKHLPQSADDATIRGKVKTVLDQLGLYIENFYQDAVTPGSQSSESDIAIFDSKLLPGQMATLMRTSRKAKPLIQHALDYMIMTSISLTGDPAQSLLPTEFILLPGTIANQKLPASKKPGYEQSISRWRELTAYLRPDPSQDKTYVARRDQQIDIIIRTFSRAFAPWQVPQYTQQQRSNSLSSILKSAVDLGIYLFAQPSEMQFQWPKPESLGHGGIVVSPALIKVTDEQGRQLRKVQTVVQAVVA